MREQSEEAIRQRIEETRARMGHTIEQIGDHVNPDRVRHELKQRAREQMHEFRDDVKQKARNTMRDVEHEVKQTGHSMWDTIRQNPVPAGMVGVGLAWLMANRSGSNRNAADDYRTYSTGPGTRYGGTGGGAGYEAGYTGTAYTGGTAAGAPRPGTYPPDSVGTGGYSRDFEYGDESGGRLDEMKDRAGGAAESVRGKAEHAADNVREKAEHAAGDVRERAEHAAGSVRETASDVADRASHTMHEAQHRAGEWIGDAQYRAQRIEHRAEDAVQENPFAAGAVALAMGLAAGLMIPETQKEHELMGRTRERVLDRAQETAHRASGKVRETLKDTAGEAARGAVDQAWAATGGDEQSESFSEPGR